VVSTVRREMPGGVTRAAISAAATRVVASVPFALALVVPMDLGIGLATSLAVLAAGLIFAVRLGGPAQSVSISGRPSKSTAEYSASFSNRWKESITRIVPLLDRMTIDCVAAPPER
jgi:hypothetical protein